MAEKKLYKFNVRKNIRVFNLSNGRQVFVKDGYFETDDRQLGLMIAEEYKTVVTMAVGTATPGAAPIDPISGSLNAESDKFKPLLSVVDEEDDDWGDDDEEGAGAAGGATTQPGTTTPLSEGEQAAADALKTVVGAAAAGAAAVAAEKKTETAAEKKAREKAEREAAKANEAK